MMDKKKYNFSGIGNLEEGWWDSIMTEDNYGVTSIPSIRKVLGRDSVDWNYIRELFHTEKIVSCEVLVSNTGGVLVSSDMVTGFVPVSHLTDFPILENDQTKIKFLEQQIGKILKLKIIECDKKRGRIILSERAALSKPGERRRLLRSLKRGAKVKGTVTNITEFGVFVDLGGLEGLVHLSELSWGRVTHPTDVVDLGQEIDVLVLNMNKKNERVSLSLKQITNNPWENIHNKYPPAAKVQGKITKVTRFGAFVELGDGLEGLIHISEMGLSEGMLPKDILGIGDFVEIEVARIDPGRKRMSFRLIG